MSASHLPCPQDLCLLLAVSCLPSLPGVEGLAPQGRFSQRVLPGCLAECGLRPGAVRVVGGVDVPLGRWPWQVSVYHGSQHRCGGSVLAREWIVTAAHCVHRYRWALPCPASGAAYLLLPQALAPAACSTRHGVFLLSSRRLQASAWLVFAGIIAHGSIKQEAGVSVEKIIYHPLYNDSSLDYDIALMKLQVPLNFSGKMLLHPPPVWSCLS